MRVSIFGIIHRGSCDHSEEPDIFPNASTTRSRSRTPELLHLTGSGRVIPTSAQLYQISKLLRDTVVNMQYSRYALRKNKCSRNGIRGILSKLRLGSGISAG